MCYYDETYPVEVCKWNQKVEQIKLGKQGNKTWNF